MAKAKTEIEDNDGEVSLVLVVPQARMLIDEPQEAEMQAVANELLAKYPADFQIKTKSDYENLKADLRKTVKMRTQTDEWRKSIKRVADEVSDKIQRLFDPAEKRMAAIKKTYDDAEAERIRIEKEAREKLIRDRTAAVYAIGGVFNGSAYVVGDAEIYPEDLPSDGFEAKLEAMKAERVRIDEAERIRKAEAERLRLEDVERQRLAKEKADADARRIAELEAKLKAQEDEAARIAAEEKARQDRLDAIEKARETKPEPPLTINTPSGKVVEVPVVIEKRESEMRPYISMIRDYNGMLAMSDADYEKAIADVRKGALMEAAYSGSKPTPETATPSIIPTDPIERETFLAGAKAAFGMAKREFPDITPAQWRDCWRRFQEM